MIIIIHLFSTCYPVNRLNNYWLYSSHWTFNTCDINFVIESLYLLFSFTYLPPSSNSLPSGNHCLFSVSVTLLLFIYVYLFCFLDYTYKWIHTVRVFLWLMSASIICSRFICVVTNGKITFFMAEKYFTVCIHTHTHTHTCIYTKYFLSLHL